MGDEVYHPNVQKCRNIDDVVKYIKKDGDILEFGDIDWKAKVNARQEHRRYIAKELISGTKTLAQAIDEDPTLLFGARHLKQDLETYHQAKIQPLGFRCKGYLDLWTPRCWKVQTGSTRGEESVPQNLKTNGLTAILDKRPF